MSALTANRRALSSVCRRSSRMIHSSSASQARVLSPVGLVDAELEEIPIQPIFDIFDAPTRLADSSKFIQEKYKTPSQATIKSLFPRPAFVPLPTPIIFDGPARPKNDAFAFQNRMRDAGPGPMSLPRRSHTPPVRPFSSSEPLVQFFEGPARITRYRHQSSSDKEQNHFKLIVALGVAGAVGCATIAKDREISGFA